MKHLKQQYIERSPTIFLRVIISLMGLAVFTLAAFFVHALSRQDVGEYRPVLIGMCVTVIPFCFALVQTMRLLNYIDQDKAFSTASVEALKQIKHSAASISLFYVIGLPWIYRVADHDDAPGVLALGMLFAFAAMAVAVFAAVLQKLLQRAIIIQSEIDLTV